MRTLFCNPEIVNPESAPAGRPGSRWREAARRGGFWISDLTPTGRELLAMLARWQDRKRLTPHGPLCRGEYPIDPGRLAAASREGRSRRSYQRAIRELADLGILDPLAVRPRHVSRFRLADLGAIDTWTTAASRREFVASLSRVCRESDSASPCTEGHLDRAPTPTLNSSTPELKIKKGKSSRPAADSEPQAARRAPPSAPTFHFHDRTPDGNRPRRKILDGDPEADKRLWRDLAAIRRSGGVWVEPTLRWCIREHDPSPAQVLAILGECRIGVEAGRISRPAGWLRACFRDRCRPAEGRGRSPAMLAIERYAKRRGITLGAPDPEEALVTVPAARPAVSVARDLVGGPGAVAETSAWREALATVREAVEAVQVEVAPEYRPARGRIAHEGPGSLAGSGVSETPGNAP